MKLGAYPLIFLLAVLFLEGNANSYPTPVDFDGTLIRWNITKESPDITYEVSADDADDIDFYAHLVFTSASLWNDVPTSYFNFVRAEEGTTAQVTIELSSSFADPTAAGYSKFDEVTDKNEPVHCKIVVAQDPAYSYDSFGKTILHELGHCVGLGHSIIPQAIMSYYLEENTFDLDTDDKAAISRLYPVDGSKPKLPPGCSVGSDVYHENNQMLSFLNLFFLLVPILVVSFLSRRTSL